MRRLSTWLCLFVALAGPLASQAKVAYGIALSRAEVGSSVLESGQEIEDEDYDGRDMVTVVAHPDAGPDGLVVLCLPLVIHSFIPVPIDLPCDSHDAWCRHGGWKWPPPTARQRCALLQTLLI